MNEIKDYELFAKSNGVNPLVLHDYRRSQGYINPTIIEERTRNITAMDVFSKLLMDNIIFLGDAFNDEMANVIVSQLLWLQATKPMEEIKMYINSPGGWVSSGLAIKDTMDFVKNDISTVCVGQAASMGAFILTNGSPVNHNPPRPFLEPALAQPKTQQQIARHMKAAAKAALEGDTGGAMDQMHMAGQAGEDAVKDYMASGAFAPNSGFTINGGWMRNRVSGKPFHADPKGSSKPLIDTSNLQGSITHVVE